MKKASSNEEAFFHTITNVIATRCKVLYGTMSGTEPSACAFTYIHKASPMLAAD